ncbi:hypothetical protein Peur_033376 [Populus x canadensis]
MVDPAQTTWPALVGSTATIKLKISDLFLDVKLLETQIRANCPLADGEIEMEDLELTQNHKGEQGEVLSYEDHRSIWSLAAEQQPLPSLKLRWNSPDYSSTGHWATHKLKRLHGYLLSYKLINQGYKI